MKKCINCKSNLPFKREIMTLFFNLKIKCQVCGLIMKTDLIFDQVIELFAYFVLIFTTLATFQLLGGLSLLVGLTVFIIIKLFLYKYLYRLKKT